MGGSCNLTHPAVFICRQECIHTWVDGAFFLLSSSLIGHGFHPETAPIERAMQNKQGRKQVRNEERVSEKPNPTLIVAPLTGGVVASLASLAPLSSCENCRIEDLSHQGRQKLVVVFVVAVGLDTGFGSRSTAFASA